jgi:hypothetical protein
MDKKLYSDEYSHFSLEYHAYLLSDSHGATLSNMLEKYGIYNFAIPSDSYVDMRRKLEFLLSNHVEINTIYIVADDSPLSLYRETSNNHDRSIIYSTPKQFDHYYEYITNRYIKNYLVLAKPKALGIIRSFILSKIKDSIGIKTRPSKTWSELSVDDKIKAARDRAKVQFPSTNHSITLEQSLLDIIRICNQNNIRVVGIKFPLSSEYIRVLGDKAYGTDRILQSHNIEVLDYKNLFVNNDTYFEDQDHLNETGARQFVTLLINDIHRL